MKSYILTFIIHLISAEQLNNTTLQPHTIPHKRYHHNFYNYKANGCMFKENYNQCAVWYGTDCKEYPSNSTIEATYLKIRTTNISKIGKDDFKNLGNLTMLVLEHNLELSDLEPGCFRHLKKLTHLKLILNYKLKVLEENLFEGLDNLIHLILRKNGFENIKDVFRALNVNQIPNIIFLDLSENVFKEIQKDDLVSMNGSRLEEIRFSLASLRFIHNESLIVFKNLKTLGIDGNHFRIKNLEGVIKNFMKYQIQLETLNLQDSGYRSRTPRGLMKVIAKSTIAKLSMAQNQFEVIDRKSFPTMPKLKSLDLSDNIIISIGEGAFERIVNLEELYLAGNKFSKVFPSILIPSLKVLDLCRISNKPTAVSYFSIEDNIFRNMSKLEKLDVSYNLLESTNIYTFTGLINLKYLDMKNTTTFNVRENSFLNTPNLTYLNLENNPFKAITLNLDNFAGLSKLETLLLGGSKIANISNFPSPFTNLHNLIYLGLNNNMIYTIDTWVFEPLNTLEILDLSNNKLIPWNHRLFSNNSNIKFLDLSFNKFTSLTRAMLDDFQNITEYVLDDNPFICDCNLVPEGSLDEVLSNPNLTIINCTNSDFQNYSIGKFVKYLKNNSHYCEQEVAKSNKILIIVVSSIILIVFLVLLVLMYYYRYYIKYWLFLIKLAARRHSKWWKRNATSITTNFQYDAFVSYSNADNYFVSELVSHLENKEPYLKLCVYERDFKIGSIISEEIMQSIVESKRILLIISDGFARSQWCRWETKLAEHHQLFFQNDDTMTLDDTLVMIKLNDVSKKHITPTLKYLMKTRIYLEWNENKKQEFWDKLKNTLAAPKHRSNVDAKN